LECPTMLENGYGEHNIQGIGDKHIPLIHNVMNTDVVVAISDRSTDELDVLFNTEAGRRLLADRVGIDQSLIEALSHFGFSAICNTLRQSRLPGCSILVLMTRSSPLQLMGERCTQVSEQRLSQRNSTESFQMRMQRQSSASTLRMCQLRT